MFPVSPDCQSFLPVIAEYGPALPDDPADFGGEAAASCYGVAGGLYGPALPSGGLPSQDLDSDSEMLGMDTD